MEQSVSEIVDQINNLIRGWEREYGVTNQTMVNARNEIERLREELLISNTQLLIRRDMITHLKSGPGGIMEMKQTISDKEADIERLEQYESMIYYIVNDYIELSYEKAQWQRDDWLKRCKKIITEKK